MMQKIYVNKKEFEILIQNIMHDEGYELGPYELCLELGAYSFFGGLDHYEFDESSLTLYDRGCNDESNDVKFILKE